MPVGMAASSVADKAERTSKGLNTLTGVSRAMLCTGVVSDYSKS